MNKPMLMTGKRKSAFAFRAPTNALDTWISCMATIAVFYFSYIPLLAFLPLVQLQKETGFVLLIASIFGFMAVKFLGSSSLSIRKDFLNILFLYFLFGLYALIRYAIAGDQLGDVFTIRTLAVINPLFIVLALLCVSNKRITIDTITFLSGTYFLLLLYSFRVGAVTFHSQIVQNIFIVMGLEGNFYQTINLYMGIFCICIIRLFYHSNRFIKIVAIAVSATAIIGMLATGGRASMVGLTLVYCIWFYKASVYKVKKSVNLISKSLVVAVVFLLALVLIYLFFEVVDSYLQDFITWRRLISLREPGDTSMRLFLFSQALELFLSDAKTLFWGAGISSFPVFIRGGTGMYPHNVVLELLSEYGVAGAVLFFVFIVYILVNRYKTMGSLFGNNAEERLVFLLFVYYWTIFMFTSGLRYSWTLVFFSVLLFPNKKNQRLPTPDGYKY